MVGAFALALALVSSLPSAGQFDLGVGVGGYLYQMSISGSYGSPSVTSEQSFPMTASLFYRDRIAAKGNFFAEVDWRHREFTAHLDEGSHGGGTFTTLNARLDHLYFTLGPEFGRSTLTFRVGLQLGWLVGGSMAGTSRNWSIFPPPQGDWSRDTIPLQAPTRFNGDQRLLIAFRYTPSIRRTMGFTIDPFLSLAVSSMLRSGNKIGGIDAGLRVGVLWRRNGRGFWSRLRAGPLRVQMKEPKT